MEKLIFRTITSEEETDLVLTKIEYYSGIRLPTGYAKKARIVGVFLQNKLVASYMLVTQPGFRSLLFVPDEIRKSNTYLQTNQFQMMEVNGLWIGPALKTPVMQMKVWLHLIKDIFFCRKNIILLMRDSRNKNMERFLNMANPQTIYKGSPLFMAGEQTHSEIQVSYTSRWKIVLNMHKYLVELRNRQRRADHYAKQRTYDRTISQSDANFA